MFRLFATAAVCLWASAALAQGTAAKPDAAKGKEIAEKVCAACHGADGNSPAPANPKLAGQFHEYLYKQLANFKPRDGKKAERENPIMAGMVAPLSDADMRNLAAYYAAQKVVPAKASNRDLATLGQKIYRGGNLNTGVAACSGCHGPNGLGMPSQYPRLSGQYAEYIEAQLKLFRSGARANDANGMMRAVAARMTDKEIQAVAEYAAGLR